MKRSPPLGRPTTRPTWFTTRLAAKLLCTAPTPARWCAEILTKKFGWDARDPHVRAIVGDAERGQSRLAWLARYAPEQPSVGPWSADGCVHRAGGLRAPRLRPRPRRGYVEQTRGRAWTPYYEVAGVDSTASR